MVVGKIAKGTRKGQVTIPKEILDILDSEAGEFEVENEQVVRRPVKRVAGKLSSCGNTARIQEESSVWRNAAQMLGA